MQTRTITQSVMFKASPEEVYEALMDSKKHSAFTGAPAKISKEIGGKCSAYDGGLVSANLELIPNRQIVQSWRCVMDNWPQDHYSTATFLLKETKDGTKLEFTQAEVPDECYEEISEGWNQYYWAPMKKFLNKK